MGFAGVVAGLGVDPLRPLSISRVMVADLPLDRPLPTFLSSLTARSLRYADTDYSTVTCSVFGHGLRFN